jgi:pimeloyl-ACP methyl ester carboxylesterase
MATDELNLILLPGLDGTGILFEPLAMELNGQVPLRVMRYPAEQGLSYEALADFVLNQIEGLARIILVAESFSGPVAVLLAKRLGHRLEGIVFCATFARSPRPFLLQMARLVPLTWLCQQNLTRRLHRRYLRHSSLDEQCVQLFETVFQQHLPQILAARLGRVRCVDVTDRLVDIQVPCCYIQARQDKVVPADCVQPFLGRLKSLDLQTINGPHFILQARPKECAAVISRFLAGLGRRRRD